MAQPEVIDLNTIEPPFLSEEEFGEILKSAGLSEDELVISALTLARKIYAGRTRDSGRPFFNEHVYPVVARVVEYLEPKDAPKKERAQVVSAAVLHDGLQPRNKTPEAIDEAFGFQEAIVSEFGYGKVFDTTYHQSRILSKGTLGNDDAVEDLFMTKLERARGFPAGEYSRVIEAIDRMNNLLSSIANAQALPNKLQKYDHKSRKKTLPIVEEIGDEKLLNDFNAILDLSERAMRQMGIIPPQTKAA